MALAPQGRGLRTEPPSKRHLGVLVPCLTSENLNLPGSIFSGCPGTTLHIPTLFSGTPGQDAGILTSTSHISRLSGAENSRENPRTGMFTSIEVVSRVNVTAKTSSSSIPHRMHVIIQPSSVSEVSELPPDPRMPTDPVPTPRPRRRSWGRPRPPVLLPRAPPPRHHQRHPPAS